MSYLLDTHVFLWMQAAPERLGANARRLIDDVDNELVLSAASSWEISIKFAIGRLQLPRPPADYVPNRMETSGVSALPVQHSHALLVAGLPRHHGDPFDRILVAQAQLEGLTLITSDPTFDLYDVSVIAAA